MGQQSDPAGEAIARFLRAHGINLLLLAVLSLLIVELREQVLDSYDKSPLTIAFKARLDDYLSGDAMPHLIKRPLMKWLILGSSAVTGAGHRLANELLQFGFLAGALGLVYAAGLRFLRRGEALAAAMITGAWVMWTHLPFAMEILAVYDIAAIFFSAAGVWAVLNRSFWGLVLVLLVGSLNKETTCWLVPAWLFCRWGERPLPRVAAEVAGLCAAYLASAFLIRFLLHAPTSASAVEAAFLHENKLEFLLIGRGDLSQNVYLATLPIIVAYLGWRGLNRDLRRLLLALLFFLIPVIVFGAVWEVRIFGEALPLGALCCLWLARDPVTPEPPPPSAPA